MVGAIQNSWTARVEIVRIERIVVYFYCELRERKKYLFKRSEMLCELLYIQLNVQHEVTERANKNIRANLRLLNNEAFLKENGVLVFEVIELFDEIEHGEGNIACWKVRECKY